MNAEFQWWLLILGVVVGGALVYLVLADMHDDEPAGDAIPEPRRGSTSADDTQGGDGDGQSGAGPSDHGVGDWSEGLDRRH